ncbi:MAG: response regulator transcription factor [Actinocatenispora sp.]
MFREALRDTLSAEPDLSVVGDTGDHGVAVKWARAFRPDVMIISTMGGGDMATQFRVLKDSSPRSRIVAMAPETRPLTMREIIPLDVGAYLTKTATRLEFVALVRRVVADDQPVLVSVPTMDDDAEHDESDDRLSFRENEVLRQVAQGLTNKQIASRLYIAEGTVKRHLRNIFAKLGAVSRVDAVNKGILLRPFGRVAGEQRAQRFTPRPVLPLRGRASGVAGSRA